MKDAWTPWDRPTDEGAELGAWPILVGTLADLAGAVALDAKQSPAGRVGAERLSAELKRFHRRRRPD